jgi:hypothetical protein
MHFRDALSYLKTLDQNWLDIETSSRFQLISREGQSFFYDFNY